MALTHPGWAVLVVLLVAVTGPVAATHVASSLDAPTSNADHAVSSSGTLIDDTINDTTTTTVTDTTTTTPTTSTTVTDETLDTTTTTVTDTIDTDTTTTTATTSTTVTTDTDDSNTTETGSSSAGTIENTTENAADETTETVNSTGESIENTTDDATEETSETVDDTTNTTIETTENTTNETTETVEDTTNTTQPTATLEGATETVNSSTESLDDGATDTVDSTTDNVDSTTDSATLTDELDESTDTIEETVDSTDDVESVLSDDEDVSLEVASDNDSTHLGANAAESTDLDGEGADQDAGGERTEGDGSGDGSTGVDAETSVSVESTNQVTDPVERALGAVWQGVDGYIPEDAPVGPVGATGVGALAVLAVASRQWFVQSASSGMPTLLSGGFTENMGDWVEKLKRLAVPLRYSRYDDSDPLEHDTRRTLDEAIEVTPGINLTDLAERTGVPLSTARHHVRVLADENLVTTAKRRGKRRYYPVGADDVELADALSEPPKAAVLHALAVHGEAHVGLLADELDRDPSTITHHLQALAEDGLVERERNGRAVVNRLAASVESTLVGDGHSRTEHAELPADD